MRGKKLRERLSNLRLCETVEFRHGGFNFAVSAGRYRDGRLSEIFMSARKPGSPIDDLCRDSAILISLALQFGCPAETLLHAVTKNHDGSPATATGVALDQLCK
jgi:hypothetical protein